MPGQYPPFRVSGVVPASQTLTLTYRPRGSMPIRVTQVTAEMNGGAGASCTLRLNGALISPLVPTGDAATGEPYIWCTPGDELTVTWTGATAGLTGNMAVIYDLGPGT